MAIALNNPQLTINNVTVRYEPNTLDYNDGFGELNFRTHTAGPGDKEVVTTSDINTQIGMVKFSLISTVENSKLVREWQSNIGNNRITLALDGFDRNFSGMSVSNNPTISTGNDGNFEVEFKGNAS